MTTSTANGNHPSRYVGWNTGEVNNTSVCLELLFHILQHHFFLNLCIRHLMGNKVGDLLPGNI
jgi:hypothetical protein